MLFVQKIKTEIKQLSKEEDLKNLIFNDVRKQQGEELDQEEDKIDDEDSDEYDNQLSTAIDILKGAEVFCKNKIQCENIVIKSDNIDLVENTE